MHEQPGALPESMSDNRVTVMPTPDRLEPPSARPLIEWLQVISSSAPVCAPDDPFCELPASSANTAEPATEPR